jgi:hypothetical protein
MWRLWGTAAVILLVAATCALLPGKPDDQIRYCGLILQLLGVGTVVALLQDKTRTMGKLGLLAHLQGKWATRPSFRPKTQIISVGGIASSTSFGSAHASVWRRASESDSDQDRIAILEANTESLRDNIVWHAKQTEQTSQRLSTELDEERKARGQSVSAVESKLDKLGAGGLHIEAAGLFWLLLGLVLATIPTEVATLLGLAQ